MSGLSEHEGENPEDRPHEFLVRDPSITGRFVSNEMLSFLVNLHTFAEIFTSISGVFRGNLLKVLQS